jgi:MFS family permease
MTDVAGSSGAGAYPPADVVTGQQKRLFLGCFVSLVATAFGFIVRALLLNDLGVIFNLSETQKGAINGAGLFPFAISIILFSLVVDRLGYGKVMIFAFLGHIVGTIMMLMAMTSKSYGMLYSGTLVLALANGAVEAVINPVTATLFPRNKTHWLNILHAGWPGGLVLGGVFVLLMRQFNVDVKWQVGLVLLPTILYGILLVGQRWPVQERVAAGVSYADMMREFGAGGAFILMVFLTMAILTVVSVFVPASTQTTDSWLWMNNWLPWIVGAVSAIGFFAIYKSFGRPMFIFLLLVMILLATTELGVDSWVTDLMTPAFGKHAGWILVYTSAIMFVLRFFAGPIVHRISPLGLLAVCAALAALGLWSLSAAHTAFMVVLAATLYGVGKTFFWPTTLGVVAEQFPRGGALTLNAMGGMGMIAVGVLGGPFLGALLDDRVDERLATDAPAVHSRVAGSEASNYGLRYRPISNTAVSNLPPDQQQQVTKVREDTKQGTLKTVTIFPIAMLACYIAMILYFKARGGYQAEVLTGHAAEGEKFTGGVAGPADR